MPHLYLHSWLVVRMAFSLAAFVVDAWVIWRMVRVQRAIDRALLTQFERWSVRMAPWFECGVALILLCIFGSALAQSTAPKLALIIANQLALVSSSVFGAVRAVLLLYTRRRGQSLLLRVSKQCATPHG